ncbi:MAG TPA: hypothetical protein PK397_00755 [Ignavibacteriaceae bacterium]|jgi:uncharacterized membrane protein|nr:hypothetical protein [Candidatus Gastranaerophilales bacterium]HPI36446.1 hypothetical protein [Ignavibacteriaceae bacterium]
MLLQTEAADIKNLLLIILGSAALVIGVLLTLIFVFLNNIRKKNELIGKLQHKLNRMIMEEKLKEISKDNANEKKNNNS